MRKKIICIILAVSAFLAICTAGYALGDSIVQTVLENRSEKRLAEAINGEKIIMSDEQIKGSLTEKNLEKKLINQGLYSDEIAEDFEKYAESCIMYNMSKAESEYILSLVNEGCDFGALLDVYQFLQHTDKDLSVVRELYAYYDEEGNNEEFWIENAYAAVTGTEQNALSREDLEYYLDRGISIKDIVNVYEMSLAGVYTEKEILDRHINGESWAEISSSVYNDAKMKDVFSANDSLNLINNSVNISRILGCKPSDIVEKTNSGSRIKENSVMAYREKDEKVESIMSSFKTDEIIVKEAAAQCSLDETTVAELFDKGYKTKDIKKALEGDKSEKSVKINSQIEKSGKEADVQ